MKIEIGQVITQIISFLIMLWVLKRYAWKPILTLLDERKDRIKREFESIEEQKKQLESLKNEYQEKLKSIDNQARTKFQEALDQAQKDGQKIQQQAHNQAKSIIAKAQEELQKDILKAKDQLKNDFVEVTFAAAQKVMQTNLDHEKQKALIPEFINKAGFN
jgi:F-type H+-transporting ATPase subunit b